MPHGKNLPPHFPIFSCIFIIKGDLANILQLASHRTNPVMHAQNPI